MEQNPAEFLNTLTSLVNSLTSGMSSRMESMDRKVDKVLDAVAGLTAAAGKAEEAKQSADEAHSRIASVELKQATHEGRLQILTWLLTIIGGPILVMLIAAGIMKLFNIELG
jgi:hypothetical protein